MAQRMVCMQPLASLAGHMSSPTLFEHYAQGPHEGIPALEVDLTHFRGKIHMRIPSTCQVHRGYLTFATW